MLESLQDDGLLKYNRAEENWSWNEQDICLTFQQTTVVELVTDKIFQLPKEAQDMLKVAACLGSKLNIELLSHALSMSVESFLEMAADIGLLLLRGTPKRYEFAHDGIREATYNLIPVDSRASFHLDIGRSLKRLDVEQLDAYIFIVIGQLDKARVLIRDRRERNEVAGLCLRGGAYAARSSSFKTAAKYFLFGIEMLDDRSWMDEYEMCLELHNCAAEVEYCNGHFESLDSLVKSVIAKARSFPDTLRVCACQVYSLGGRNLMSDAIIKGLAVLKKLGVSFPRNPGRFDVMTALRRTRKSIRKFKPEDILTLSLMRDQNKLAAMQMMNLLFLYAFSCQSLLAPLMVCRMVDLTLDHGLCAISSCGLSLFAGLLIGFERRMDEGFLYGELAFELYHKFDEKAWLARLYAGYYAFVSGWKQPFSNILEPLKEAHRVALATGDIEVGSRQREWEHEVNDENLTFSCYSE
jgi:predicted ATPase